MSNHEDQTTIFYKLKLKRTRTPMEAIEKMRKTIKEKGATKDWTVNVDGNAQTMYVDFGEDKGETFAVSFDEKKVCDDFCKVFFPLSGEEFDDEKKSEFKALINMIYAARTCFAEMKITDDYGISESYLDTKVNKIALRELTAEELERAERLFGDGHRTVREFITALMYDLRDLPYDEDFLPYINMNISCEPYIFWSQWDREIGNFYNAFIDSFIFETTEYKNEGRIYEIKEYFGELNGTWFSVHAFIDGINEITDYYHYKSGWDPKSTQVLRLYNTKYLPLIENADDHEKCIAAYRFFMSMLDYLGFKYVGKGTKYIYRAPEMIVNAIKDYINGGKSRDFEAVISEWASDKKKYYKGV